MAATHMKSAGNDCAPQARVMWIRNTLELAEIECSAAYLPQAEQRDDLEVLTPPRALPFDAEGNLTGVAALAAG